MCAPTLSGRCLVSDDMPTRANLEILFLDKIFFIHQIRYPCFICTKYSDTLQAIKFFLVIDKVQGQPLSQVEVGRSFTVVRVLSKDRERLDYLGNMGLFPNTEIRLLDKAPFDGPLTLEVGTDRHIIAHEMADRILVIDPEDKL